MDSQIPTNQRLYSLDYLSPQAAEENFLNDLARRSLNAGHMLYSFGRHLNALMAFKNGLLYDPSELRLHLMLVVTYRCLGKIAEANNQLNIISRLRSSPEIANLVDQTIKNWGYVPNVYGELPLRTMNEVPHIGASLFGIDGEFGNQIFQYAFLKLYSEKYGLILELDPWIGDRLFSLWDAPVTMILPFILEVEYLRDNLFALPPWELGISDRDTQGYFQAHTQYLAPYRKKFISLFQPVAIVESIMQEFLREIRKQGKTLVAIHLRKGDAEGQNRTTDCDVYLNWLRELWPTLDNPMLFLASDDIKMVKPLLMEFKPITSESVKIPVPGAGYYPDFYVLTQADYLAVGNSTFSFAASMLNQKAKTFVRPNAENTNLIPYDPWNALPIL
jgi:hypothetical protein